MFVWLCHWLKHAVFLTVAWSPNVIQHCKFHFVVAYKREKKNKHSDIHRQNENERHLHYINMNVGNIQKIFTIKNEKQKERIWKKIIIKTSIQKSKTANIRSLRQKSFEEQIPTCREHTKLTKPVLHRHFDE